jgi:hypothetical protein
MHEPLDELAEVLLELAEVLLLEDDEALLLEDDEALLLEDDEALLLDVLVDDVAPELVLDAELVDDDELADPVLDVEPDEELGEEELDFVADAPPAPPLTLLVAPFPHAAATSAGTDAISKGLQLFMAPEGIRSEAPAGHFPSSRGPPTVARLNTRVLKLDTTCSNLGLCSALVRRVLTFPRILPRHARCYAAPHESRAEGRDRDGMIGEPSPT